MKKIMLYLTLLLTTNLVWADSALYEGKCRNTNPLETHDRCSEHSAYGYGAYICAVNQAFLKCKAAGNVDCLELGTSYELHISRDFIGYKACEARVTIRGWR